MPPFPTESVPEERAPLALALTAPAPKPENLTVEEAKIVPKKGEEEALKEWTVPPAVETMSNGPWAEKVWVELVSPLSEVRPVPPAPMQVPLGRQTFPVPRIWMPPEKVEVALPKAAKAPPESISPEDSMAPAVVVALPTPRPPEMLPVEVAPMNAEPPTESSWDGEVVPMPRSPKGEGEVEIERTGMLEVEVAMEKALMARLGIVEVEEDL